MHYHDEGVDGSGSDSGSEPDNHCDPSEPAPGLGSTSLPAAEGIQIEDAGSDEGASNPYVHHDLSSRERTLSPCLASVLDDEAIEWSSFFFFRQDLPL